MKNIYLIFIAVAFFACNTAPKNPVVKTTGSSKKVIKIDNSANTSKVYTPGFPADTIYPARVLTEGDFHEDEVDKKDGKRKWMGLFKTDSDFYLASFDIKISRVKDDIVDDKPGQKTGWEVRTGNRDSSFLLISGLSDMKPRVVEAAIKTQKEIEIGKPLVLNINNVDYKIYAVGDKKILTGPEDYVYRNYKLLIRAIIDGQAYEQVLASSDEVTYNMTIHFAGDLDGDGVLDLIIDTTNHENVGRPTLYLSKPADKGQLLKVMGLHTVVGC